jgi:uncharacterized protein (TIGR03067 family)
MKNTRTFLSSLAIAALFTTASANAAEVEAGFKSLFNGRDLSGWEGNPKLWSVQDGTITGKTGSDEETAIKHNTFLVWKGGDVSDFELRLSYRIVQGNSGIQYRSKVVEQGRFGPIVGGYQADFEAGKTYSGILYEERQRGILAQRGQKTVIKDDNGKTKIEVTGSLGKSEDIQAKIKDEDWNDYVVIARGNHLQHFINGVQTIDVTDEQEAKAAKSGILALQIHVGPPMTVQFKNIRIKSFETGQAGGDLKKFQGKWQATAGMMNGETLSQDQLDAIVTTFEEGKFRSVWDGGSDSGSFSLNESATPRALDATSEASGNKIPAIYEFTADGLRICYSFNGAERSKDFSAPSDSQRLVLTYRKK